MPIEPEPAVPGTEIEYSPHKNAMAISLIEQPDGNWVAEGSKFGKVVRIREGSPTSALQRLLVDDGVVQPNANEQIYTKA